MTDNMYDVTPHWCDRWCRCSVATRRNSQRVATGAGSRPSPDQASQPRGERAENDSVSPVKPLSLIVDTEASATTTGNSR